MTPTETYKELTPGWRITIQILTFMLTTGSLAGGWMFTTMLDVRERLVKVEERTQKIPPDWFERYVNGLDKTIQEHGQRIRQLEVKNH